MAVSMAVIPTLKGEAADDILETLKKSQIKPYSEQEKKETERKMQEYLMKRDEK